MRKSNNCSKRIKYHTRKYRIENRELQQNKIANKVSHANAGSLLQTEDSKIWRTIETRGLFESAKAMKSNESGRVGYCINVPTESDTASLKSIPSVCEKGKWQFVGFISRFMAD